MASSVTLFGGLLTVSWYLITIVTTLVIAQGLKYGIVASRSGKWYDISPLYLSGGMPSVHSALVVSLLVVIAKLDGADSAIFAVATVLTIIVIYDSMMVRRSSGEQGGALRAFLREQKSRVLMPYVAKGHTIKEVVGGIIIGFIIGLGISSLV